MKMRKSLKLYAKCMKRFKITSHINILIFIINVLSEGSCNQQACQSISSKTDKMILFILPQTTKNTTDKPSMHSSQQPTMITFKLPSWHPSQNFTAKPLLPTQTQTGKKKL